MQLIVCIQVNRWEVLQTRQSFEQLRIDIFVNQHVAILCSSLVHDRLVQLLIAMQDYPGVVSRLNYNKWTGNIELTSEAEMKRELSSPRALERLSIWVFFSSLAWFGKTELTSRPSTMSRSYNTSCLKMKISGLHGFCERDSFQAPPLAWCCLGSKKGVDKVNRKCLSDHTNI